MELRPDALYRRARLLMDVDKTDVDTALAGQRYPRCQGGRRLVGGEDDAAATAEEPAMCSMKWANPRWDSFSLSDPVRMCIIIAILPGGLSCWRYIHVRPFLSVPVTTRESVGSGAAIVVETGKHAESTNASPRAFSREFMSVFPVFYEPFYRCS